MGSAEGHWSDMVSRQTVKRDHWKALKDTFLRLSTAGFGGWTINYRWKRQAVLCTVRNCFAASAYWVPTALSPQLWQSVYRCCQVPGRKKTPHWLTKPGWKPLTWYNHQEETAAESGSWVLSWGYFRDKQEWFPGAGLNGETRGTLVGPNVHGYTTMSESRHQWSPITFTTLTRGKGFLRTVFMQCHSFCFSETSKHY